MRRVSLRRRLPKGFPGSPAEDAKKRVTEDDEEVVPY